MKRSARRLAGLVALTSLCACVTSPPGNDCPSGSISWAGGCAQLCNSDNNCDDLAQVCEDGICVDAPGAACATDEECATPGSCEVDLGATCLHGGICQYAAKPFGEACDDASACTSSDQCDGDGTCTGQPMICNSPPENECMAGNQVYRVYENPGLCVASTGECEYSSIDIDCDNCIQTCWPLCAGIVCDQLNGGCQSNGICDPDNPGTCSYDRQPDGAACDLGGVGSQDGTCIGGACVQCRFDSDCANPPGHPACYASACTGGTCEYTVQAGVVCEVQACASGVLTSERTCAADGTCFDPGGTSCGGFDCDATGQDCLTVCADSGDCLPGQTFCDAAAACIALLADGADCSLEGSGGCLSGYCDGNLCCSGGACCNAASGCPSSYDAPAVCDDTSPATDCQGQRRDKACVGNVCVSQDVDDDVACGGLIAECTGNFAPWACTNIEDQQTPQCLTTCTGDTDCKSGFICNPPNCVARLGLGDACTGGPGQGTCLVGLKCENAVCCDATGPTCCNVATDCGAALACDATASACLDACNDYDDTRCADPATQFCIANACVSKRVDGQSCTDDGECLNRNCVEGVCCNSACAGTCESCRSGLTGQAEGTCATMPAGSQDTAPINLCTAGGLGCTGGSCACDGAGATPGNCKPAVGQDCSLDLDCASGYCECANTQCSVSKCSASRCGLCEYNATGSSCLPGLGNPGPVDDPQDCTGINSCYAGLCSLDTGQGCTADSACGLGNCECGDPTCTTVGALCADTACGVCEFTSSGTTCDGDLAPTTSCNDGDACTTTDACSGGQCVGSDPVQCNTPPDQCYLASGVCNPIDGSCSYGVKAAGTPCNDGDGTTTNDVCDGAGSCAGTCGICPDAFAFTDRIDVSVSTLTTSNIVQITGLSSSVTVTISGDGSPQYRICNDATCSGNPAWGSAPGSISNNQYLQLRLTSNAAGGVMSSATVNVGAGSDQWDVTPTACDTTPTSYATPGTDTYIVPIGCMYVFIEAYGAGGGGDDSNSEGSGGGGASVVERTDTTLLAVGGGGGGATDRWGGGGGGYADAYVAIAASEQLNIWVGGGALADCGSGSAGGAVDGGTFPGGSSVYGGGSGGDSPDGGGSTYGGGGGSSDGSAGSSIHGGGGGSTSSGLVGTSVTGNAGVVRGGGGGGGYSYSGGTVFKGSNGTSLAGGAAANGGPGAGGGDACATGDGGDGKVVISASAVDSQPDAFDFTDQTGVALSTSIESGIIQITGIGDGVAISISGAASAEYRICNDDTCSANPAYGSGASTINNDQWVQLHLTSAASNNTTRSATLTVGLGSDQWNVATPDDVPNPFTFADQMFVPLSTLIESDIVQITGIDDGVTISIAGTGSPEYRICNDDICSGLPAYGGGASTIDSNQYVQLRLTSAASTYTTRSATLTVGTGSDQWDVTTTCVAPASCPNVGDICTDGSLFAGFSMYGGGGTCEPLFVTSINQSADSQWKTSTGTDDIATDSNEDGKVNDTQVPNSTTFPAFKLCKDLNLHGQTDWYLPAREEILRLYNSKGAINANAGEAFVSTRYWASTEVSDTTARWQRLGNAGVFASNRAKDTFYDVRCVRRD